MSERLQDYKILSEGKGYKITREEDYKSLSKGESAIFFLEIGTLNLNLREFGPENWTSILDLSSVFGVCPFIDEMKLGKS